MLATTIRLATVKVEAVDLWQRQMHVQTAKLGLRTTGEDALFDERLFVDVPFGEGPHNLRIRTYRQMQRRLLRRRRILRHQLLAWADLYALQWVFLVVTAVRHAPEVGFSPFSLLFLRLTMRNISKAKRHPALHLFGYWSSEGIFGVINLILFLFKRVLLLFVRISRLDDALAWYKALLRLFHFLDGVQFFKFGFFKPWLRCIRLLSEEVTAHLLQARF